MYHPDLWTWEEMRVKQTLYEEKLLSRREVLILNKGGAF